eukprot:symbB.v1.2.035084.t1/scaffold4648.1/size53790/3
MAPAAPNSRRTFHGNPREEAQRDAAGIKLLQKKFSPAVQKPSEGDRVLLRTKPKEKLDEVLALKARLTMHKWKKDGSTYLPLSKTAEAQDGKEDRSPKKSVKIQEQGERPQDNLKSILDNYPGSQAFAPPARVADKNEDGKVLDKADLVDAVSNILMQMPPENILESSSAIGMLAKKLVDGENSAIDSSFSQKFLMMSQIQVEVQRRLKEAKGYIEDIENMDKVENPKTMRRRHSSITNLVKILHGGAPASPPPSKSEQVANQMRTIRRLLQSLHWPNLHHEFLKWVRNSSGYEVTVRDFLRGMEEDFDAHEDIDHARDDVCVSITKHELRLTKNLRRYQLQMRNVTQDLAKGEVKPDKEQRKLDQALERKANAKRAEIRRISLRRQFTSAMSLGARVSPRGSDRGSPRSSRRSSMARGTSSAATPSAISTESEDDRRNKQADGTPSNASEDQQGGDEFDIETYDDARFGHLKRIYKSHQLKIEALNDSLARDNLRLKKVIEELKDQVRRLLELQAMYESRTKSTLRRGSLFVPRRGALMLNRNQADANNVNVLAKRIAHLHSEKAELMEKIKELGKTLLQQKEKPRRGAIVNGIWNIVQEDAADVEKFAKMLSQGQLTEVQVQEKEDEKDLEAIEPEASEEEEDEPDKNEKGTQAIQQQIGKLNEDLNAIKEKITAMASQVNQKAQPMNLGKAVAFEMQPQMRLIIHYTPLRPEIDFLLKKAQEFLALPKMQTAKTKKPLEDTLEAVTDTFDTEAAERKQALQDGSPFDAAKWEQDLQQCIALLTEQLLSCLDELTQELGRKKSIDASKEHHNEATSGAVQTGLEGAQIAGKSLTSQGRGNAAGSPSSRTGRAKSEASNAAEGSNDRDGQTGPEILMKVDQADLEAKRAEEARLKAQAEEAQRIMQVHYGIQEADEEIRKLLEEISQAKAKETIPAETETVAEIIEAPTIPSTEVTERSESESEPKKRRSSRVEDADEKVQSLIKAEGRKKQRMLQLRNNKFNMLKKLLEQAGIMQELRFQPKAPETSEERKQLGFWDNRIEQRKNILDTEKGKLRKEFGRNWERKLERALLEQDQPDEPPDFSDSADSESIEPEEDLPDLPGQFDLDTIRQTSDGAADNFVMSQKSHIIAKKYSRQIRSTVFRKLQAGKEVEEEEGPNGLERKPLASFPEVDEDVRESMGPHFSLEGESLLPSHQYVIRSHSRTWPSSQAW